MFCTTSILEKCLYSCYCRFREFKTLFQHRSRAKHWFENLNILISHRYIFTTLSWARTLRLHTLICCHIVHTMRNFELWKSKSVLDKWKHQNLKRKKIRNCSLVQKQSKEACIRVFLHSGPSIFYPFAQRMDWVGVMDQPITPHVDLHPQPPIPLTASVRYVECRLLWSCMSYFLVSFS